jgi:hypothetical protein
MVLSPPTVTLGLVGALLAPLSLSPTQFVSLLLVGAFLGSFVALLARSVAENRALDTHEALVHAGRHAVVGAVWAVGAGALVFSLGPYGWAAAVAAVVGYPLARRLLRMSGRSRPEASRTTPANETDPGRLSARPPLQECSTSELAVAWGASYDLLQAASSPQMKARIVALRAAYLDELERRDRLGVSRWLSTASDPASDIGQYFRGSDDEVDQGPA